MAGRCKVCGSLVNHGKDGSPALWMRESAQRADSAMTASFEAHRRPSDAKILSYPGVLTDRLEFPKAMHALRTRPRRLARLMALCRNTVRNLASSMDRSHSSLGKKRDSSGAGGRS